MMWIPFLHTLPFTCVPYLSPAKAMGSLGPLSLLQEMELEVRPSLTVGEGNMSLHKNFLLLRVEEGVLGIVKGQ